MAVASDEKPPGTVARLKAGATEKWTGYRDTHRWIRHVLAAWQLLQRNNGNQYAAAITYFSFLALFPLLLLAVAVTGFVLHGHPALQQDLFDKVSQNVPGQFGTTLKDSLRTAIKARTGVGIVGLVGVLLTGLGWIGNLRGAIDGVWGRIAPKRSFIGGRVSSLLVLGGLGLGIVISLGLTVVGTAVTTQILSLVGLDGVPGFTLLLKVLGIVIAVGGDMIIFWWLLVRLPQVDVSRNTALRGALLAAIGFEILKIAGTYTIANTAGSPTAGPFAGIIAILVWIQLVSRWMLFCCAWLATMDNELRMANTVPIVEPEPMVDERAELPPASPAAVGATLVGAGAIAGAVATWAVRRSRADDET